MDNVEQAWYYFKNNLLLLCDKHADCSFYQNFRIGGENNPWFNDAIFSIIRQRAKAKKSNNPSVLQSIAHFIINGKKIQNPLIIFLC